MSRLCQIDGTHIEFNMCSLSKPTYLPRNTIYLGLGKIMNLDGTKSAKFYHFYYIHYKNYL